MYKVLLATIFLMSIHCSSLAQERVIFDKTKQHSYLVKNQAAQGPDKSQKVLNRMLKAIAHGNGQHLSTTRFEYTLNERRIITKRGQLITGDVSLSINNFKGNTEYRGFDIRDFLLPEAVRLQLSLVNKQNTVLKSKDTRVIMDPNGSNVSMVYTDTLNQKGLKLLVKNRKLVYNQISEQKFIDRIGLIDEYYFFEEGMHLAFEDLKHINFNDIDHIRAYNKTLLDVEEMLDLIDSKKLPLKLKLSTHDHFVKMLDDLHLMVYDMRVRMNQVLSTLFQAYYHRGLEFLVNNDVKTAESYFVRSMEENPVFAPAAYQLAKIDLGRGQVKEADSYMRHILYKMNPDPTTIGLIFNSLNQIFDIYVEDGNTERQNKDYALALNHYNRALDLCSNVAGVNCDESVYEGIRRAKYGIYESLLDEAKEKLYAGQLKDADRALVKAFNYQRKNSDAIPNNEEAQEINIAIKQQYYNNYIAAGEQLLMQKKFEQALMKFDDAQRLEEQLPLTPNNDLTDFLPKAAKPVVLSLLARATNSVAQNDLLDAKKISAKVMDYQLKYGLTNDGEISDLLSELKKNISTQDCINAQADVDRLYGQAKVDIANRNFISGLDLLDNALQIIYDNRTCGIADEMIEETRRGILPAAVYLKLQNTANELVKNKKYQAAIDKHSEMERYFYENNVADFSIIHSDLLDFIASSGNNAFILFGANHYIDKGDPDKSVILMKKLAMTTYPFKWTRVVQEKLGGSLATRDFNQNSTLKPKREVTKYTDNLNYLKYLKKAYIKQRKKF